MTTVTAPTPQAEARNAALTRAATEKRQRAIINAEKGIRALTRTGEAITFRSVARAAGVSVNFLYTNTDLRHRIERLRALSHPATATGSQSAPPDGNNVIRELSAKLAIERKARHEETATLRAQLAAAHGELLTLRRAAALARVSDRSSERSTTPGTAR